MQIARAENARMAILGAKESGAKPRLGWGTICFSVMLEGMLRLASTYQDVHDFLVMTGNLDFVTESGKRFWEDDICTSKHFSLFWAYVRELCQTIIPRPGIDVRDNVVSVARGIGVIFPNIISTLLYGPAHCASLLPGTYRSSALNSLRRIKEEADAFRTGDVSPVGDGLSAGDGSLAVGSPSPSKKLIFFEDIEAIGYSSQ
jgi:hypothetical protein